jgi:DnaJ-class molecular chaperone
MTPSHQNSLTTLAIETLVTGDRAICSECMGRGRKGGRDGWPFSKCAACQGKGVVCPSCRGMRFIRQMKPGAQAEWQTEATRCDKCCEGNQVNDIIEMREIQRYIAVGKRRKAGQP